MNNDAQTVFPKEGLVALPPILQYLGIGKTCWWQGVKDGRFPKAVKLGKSSRWRAADIRSLAGE